MQSPVWIRAGGPSFRLFIFIAFLFPLPLSILANPGLDAHTTRGPTYAHHYRCKRGTLSRGHQDASAKGVQIQLGRL